MLAARTLLVAFAIVALATLAVDAGTRNTPQGDAAVRRPHPEETATPETRALWARIHEELKARNYSRPSSESINAARRAAGLGPVVRSPNGGAFGVDISQWMGEGTWGCLKNNGYDFGIVRAYEEVCAVDPNGVHSVANAWAAGIAHVDIYLFPSYGCGNGAAAQVDATINNMGSIPFGTLWFDIETGGQGSASSNYNWLKEGVDQAVARLGGSRVGIYSSQYEWGQVMGSYGGFTSFPVWYADYDGSPSFGGFRPFGGWTNPAMKQYAGDANVCSFDVDLNWYP